MKDWSDEHRMTLGKSVKLAAIEVVAIAVCVLVILIVFG